MRSTDEETFEIFLRANQQFIRRASQRLKLKAAKDRVKLKRDYINENPIPTSREWRYKMQ
jgi:hypothetical protein